MARSHGPVAFVGDQGTTAYTRDRRKGARAAADSAGIPLAIVTTSELTMSAGRASVSQLLAADPPLTAVFCGSDLLALGVMNELLERGKRIPEDMAVVGYDDSAYFVIAAVPLTSVRQPR